MEIDTDKLRVFVEDQEVAATATEGIHQELEGKGLHGLSRLAWIAHVFTSKNMERLAELVGIRLDDGEPATKQGREE